jgi:homoserine kinase
VRTLRTYAPASVGNVAAGFDVLGAALAPVDGSQWGDVVEIAEADADRFVATGSYAAKLPPDPADNLVMHARRLFTEACGGTTSAPVSITLHKELPLNSGLGSSSSSVVATLVGLNLWHGRPLTGQDLLGLAGAAESVYSGAALLDNVAPALFGGLQMVTALGEARTLPFPGDLHFVVVHPELELPTRVSRAAIPREIGLATAVEYGQNLAALVHALHTGDRALLRQSLRDPLVEPFRAALVRGFRRVNRAAWETGAWGCSLSGAGPTVFAVAEAAAAPAVCAAMCDAFRAEGVASEGRICALAREGAHAL